jgi:hypothetical protein
MQTFTITPPNTCGLSVIGTEISYVPAEGAVTLAPDTAAFFEYLTPDDAAVAALTIDPSYDVNFILGPLFVTPVNVSPNSTSTNYGASVTLDCEYECSDLSATISYEWFSPQGTSLGTASSLTTPGITQFNQGFYTCVVTAVNAKGQTGEESRSFSVTTSTPAGQFYLTRNANNISTGNYNVANNFNPVDTELYFPADDLVVPYVYNIETETGDFKTVGNPLSSGAQEFDLRINGEYFASFTLGAANKTYTHNF